MMDEFNELQRKQQVPKSSKSSAKSSTKHKGSSKDVEEEAVHIQAEKHEEL